MHKLLNVLFFLTVILNACDVHALKCHQCSSVKNSTCADPFTDKDFLIECPHATDELASILEKTDPTVCRKLKQTIDGNVRITRSCGYIKDNRTSAPGAKSCFKDAFTSHTSSFYCDCFEDECNMGNGVGTNVLLMLATIFIAVKFCFN